MADGGENKAGRPEPGRPPVFIPSYDAPTTPMPKVGPEDAPPKPGARPPGGRKADERGPRDPDARPADRVAPSPRSKPPYGPPLPTFPRVSPGVPDDTAPKTPGPKTPGGGPRPPAPTSPNAPGNTARNGPGNASRNGPPNVPGNVPPNAQGDSDATVTVRRRQGVGPFPTQRPFPADQIRPSTPAPPPPSFALEPEPKRKPFDGVILRIGDIPLRAVYTVAALIATIAAVVLVFTVFAEDQPQDTVNVNGAQTSAPGAPARGSASPDPVAALKLPAVPSAKPLPTLTGTQAVVIGLVVDDKSGFTYARLGEPWATATVKPFSTAQQVGKARSPRTLIASAPLPGAVPADLDSDAEYRALTAKAARWTLRQQPAPTRLVWTASQPLPGGKGWVLGYRVSYQVQGKTHTSQAIVVVADTGKKKPGLLFATVPDTRKDQYRDLATLVSSIQRAR